MSGKKSYTMKNKHWEALGRKERSLINVCYADSMLLNVFEETIMMKL